MEFQLLLVAVLVRTGMRSISKIGTAKPAHWASVSADVVGPQHGPTVTSTSSMISAAWLNPFERAISD
jgi:hypothetical protein